MSGKVFIYLLYLDERNKGAVAQRKPHKRRRKRRAAVTYPTTKVVDYLNERALKEHDEKMAVKNLLRFHWGTNEYKPKAYYTSNESKKKPLYKYNERALLEKEMAKQLDYENYMADEDYQNKPKAYYFKDDARYKNKPKTLSEKMGHDERPKYKYKRLGWAVTDEPKTLSEKMGHDERPKYKYKRLGRALTDEPTTPPERTTWAVVHLTPLKRPFKKPHITEEIAMAVAEGKANAIPRQEALLATGKYPLAHALGNRTTYRLSTYRDFIGEAKTFEPYTFPLDPLQEEMECEQSNQYIPSEEVTTPRNWKDWVMRQLVEYRKKYIGLTVAEPFAHYPEYTWENLGFDLAKIEDPFPPIWPEKHINFNAAVMKAHFAETASTPAVFDPREWDSGGKEKVTIYTPPINRVIIPGI